MNTKEFDKAVQRMVKALPRRVIAINKTLALSAIPMIKNNLIEKGVTGEGRSLGQYSDKPLNPGMLIPQALNQIAEKRIESTIKKQAKKNGGAPMGISYKQFREFNNRPTNHVTLSFSGETLNDLAIISNQIEGKEVITEVGSKNSKTKEVYNKKGKKTGTVGTGDVLDQLGARYGDILSLTRAQEKEITEAFDDEIQYFLDEYFEND